jgi:hypothetical protein
MTLSIPASEHWSAKKKAKSKSPHRQHTPSHLAENKAQKIAESRQIAFIPLEKAYAYERGIMRCGAERE